MGASIHLDLAKIFASIKIVSQTAISFRNEPEIDTAQFPIPALAPGHPPHPVSENALVRTLQAVLYYRCYCHRFDAVLPRALGAPVVPSPSYIEQLSQANRSEDHWESGWRVYQALNNGSVCVAKGDRQRYALPGEYVTEEVTFRPLAIGAPVRLRGVRDSTAVQIGFYFMFGQTPGDEWDRHYTLRFYFNSSASGTPLLIDYLTSTLNRFQVPFHMKALTDPDGYTRADSMVLYLVRRYHHIATRIVHAMPEECSRQLGEHCALFARPIRPGVGVAEDPNTGESFGMHRCRLVAEGIVDAWTKGRQEVWVRARAVRNRFLENGVDPDRPHLSFGLKDLPYQTGAGVTP